MSTSTIETIWNYAQSQLETLKLVDGETVRGKALALAQSWEIPEPELDIAARVVLQTAWELHPLQARLGRQLAEIEKDSPEGTAVRNAFSILPSRLVETNWGMVKKAAVRLHVPTQLEDEAEFQELLSVGREALFLAAQKYFKKPRGEFKNFAWSSIRDRMREEQRSRHPVPASVRKKLAQLDQLREEYHLRDIRLTNEMIGRELKLDANELRELLATESVWGTGQAFEHDHELDELEEPDHSPDSLAMILEVENARVLDEAMGQLEEPDSLIIKKLYFEEKSYREAAEELGFTLPAFKRYHKRALESMRTHLQGE